MGAAGPPVDTGAMTGLVTSFTLAYRVQGAAATRSGALEHLSVAGTRQACVHASDNGITACARVSSWLSGSLAISCGHLSIDGPAGARLMAIALSEAACLHEQASAARSGQAAEPLMTLTVSIPRKALT